MQYTTMLAFLACALSTTVFAIPTVEVRQNICDGNDGGWGCYKFQAFTCKDGQLDQVVRCVNCRIVNDFYQCD
jgi:hypothetical protein